MTDKEIKQALGYILYNLCYHHRDGDAPLSQEEIEILLLDDEDRKQRRKTYCICLEWAKKNPDVVYTDLLLEKRRYSNEYIHSYLMEMYMQMENAGVFEKFSQESSST